MQKHTTLANELWPLLLPRITALRQSSSVTSGGSATGSLAEHDLGGSLHKGLLRDEQAPQFLLASGTRPLTGNLAVASGVTIDGVDLSAHAADPNAHHNRQHGILSASDHTVVGSAWQTVGLTASNTLGLLTPLADVTGATKEALLKSDSSGYLSLVRGVASDRLRAPLLDTASGGLTIKPASELILDPNGGSVRLTSGKLIKSTGFTSGFTGAGWQIDDGIISAGRTSAEVDDLTVRGRMRIYELLIQQIRATNGSLFVTSGSKVVTVAAVPSAWTVNGAALTFNGSPATLDASFYTISTAAAGDTDRSLYHGFLYGDLPVAQQTRWNGSAFAGVMQSKLEVTRIDSLTQYGAVLVSGDAPEVGLDYVRRGNTVDPNRRGAIYLTSDDSAAPYIDVVDGLRSHADWNQVGNVKVRMGKLAGISGQADAYGIFSGDNSRAWISSEAINGFRIGYAGATRLQADMTGTLRLLNAAEEPVITLDSGGASYFAGVMTIGTAGEIRQGTGVIGSDYTGLRIWRDGDVGRIGGYKADALQWYADTGGEMRAGGGVVALAGDGLGMARYTTDAGTPIAGTEADAALAWWDDIDNRTGAPLARIYGARSSAGTGAVPSLSIEVDQDNADEDSRPSIWLIGKSAQPTQIWFNDIDTFAGIPGLVPSRNPTTRAESVAFSGQLTFKSHLLRDPLNANIDIGASGSPFRTLYVGSIVAGTITGGTSIGGAVWQNDAANMYIRSNSASSRTLYVANDGAGVMGLNVEGDIALGGTVDGVDVAAFYSAYGAHTHSHSALTGIGANDHHNQQHAMDGSDHTASGLTAGWVLRASGATTFAWAQLAHSDLSGLTIGDPHTQYALRARQVIAGAGMTGGGALDADRTLAVGAGTLITVGADDVGLSAGTAQYQVIVTGASPFTPAYTALSNFAGDGLSFTAGKFVVGAGAGITVAAGGTTVALTTPGGLSVSSTNSASGNHTHAITSSADPDATASLLATTAAGLLTLRNGAFRQAAQSYATFASGFAGSGWRVDYGITTANKASAEFDDLTVRGQMRIYELLIQQIRATNGSLFVTSSSKVVGVTATSNAWTVNGQPLTFNGSAATFNANFYTVTTAAVPGDNDRALYHGFLYGDLPVAQQVQWNGTDFAGVKVSKIEVTRVDSLTQYGAVLVEGSAPAAGLDYVRRGSTVNPSRRGAIYLTSDDASAPFIDILDGLQYHADWGSASVQRVRLGKLSGITDTDFGGTLDGYGLYANRAYIKGMVVVTGGSLGGLAAADVNANTTTIDGGRITALSVTAAQIAANTITASQMAANTITASQIAANTITAAQIAANTITASQIAASTITAAQIAASTITAAQIAANTITAAKLSVSTLSAIAANLGTVTAGSIVVGGANKLWLNDSSDGSLMIGGSTKTAAPFQVSAAGYLTAEDGTIGDFSVLDGNTFIVAPTTYSLTTKGYKFQSSGGVLIGGLTAYLPASAGALYLDNNFSSDTGSTPVQIRNATTAVRALAATGYVSTIDLYARHQATGLDSGLHIVNDPSQAAGTRRTVQVVGDRLMLNSYKVWSEDNDGASSGLDADKLDGQEGVYYTPKTNPTFPESIRFASLSTGGSSPPSTGAVSIYLTAEKRLVIAYFDGTNTRYRWMNLNSADTGWNYQLNGTVPA